MAVAWPVQIRPSVRTTIRPETGVEADRSDDGADHLRALYDQTRYVINLQLDGLSVDERETVETFLASNRLNEIDIRIAPHTYRCKIVGDYDVRYIGGFIVSIGVQLRGVRV